MIFKHSSFQHILHPSTALSSLSFGFNYLFFLLLVPTTRHGSQRNSTKTSHRMHPSRVCDILVKAARTHAELVFVEKHKILLCNFCFQSRVFSLPSAAWTRPSEWVSELNYKWKLPSTRESDGKDRQFNFTTKTSFFYFWYLICHRLKKKIVSYQKLLCLAHDVIIARVDPSLSYNNGKHIWRMKWNRKSNSLLIPLYCVKVHSLSHCSSHISIAPVTAAGMGVNGSKWITEKVS